MNTTNFISNVRLTKELTAFPQIQVQHSSDAYNHAMNLYGPEIEIFESAFALFLNGANLIIAQCQVSFGGPTSTVVDPLIVAKYAVGLVANGVIIVHNHPSGQLKPSQADIKITNQLREGLRFLNINLLDHLIVTRFGYYSFADEGML
jgi:DNA repair protein RadC